MNYRDALRILHPESAKLGFSIRSCEPGASKSDLLTDRRNLRRLANDVRDRADAESAKSDQNLQAQAEKTMDAIATVMGVISDRLDGEAMTGVSSAPSNSATVLDQSGNRIGTLLNAAALRDERQIAAALQAGRPDSADDNPKGGLAAFFRGVAGGITTPDIRASLNEGTDSAGGYAVPSYVLAPIIRALVPASSMLDAGANVAILNKQGDSFTIPAVDTIPTPGWRFEAGTVANAGPTFRPVTIVPQSLAFIFKVSRELLMDAPGMDAALNVIIAQAFAKEIDRAGLIGSGTSPEIRGILNTTGVQTYDMGTDGAAITDYGPIVKAKRVLADVNAPAPNAIITSTRETETIDLFADTTGQPLRRPTALESLLFGSTTQIPIDDTHGTATNASSMFLGDFTKATFYMREQLSVMKLSELYAGTGEVGFACHARVDLALSYPKAFCVVKGVIPA